MFEQNRKPMIIGVVILLLVAGFVYMKANKPTRSVTTVGVGKKQVQADKAVITFTVSATGADQNTVVSTGEQKVNDSLKNIQSFNPTDVRKTAYQVTQAGTSYQYATGVQMAVSPQSVDAVGKVITASGGNIAQIRYNTANEGVVGQEVREMAIQDAKTRAQQIAKASGARVGKVLVVTEQGATDQSGSSVTTAKSGADSSVFSEVEVQAALTVTFELW